MCSEVVHLTGTTSDSLSLTGSESAESRVPFTLTAQGPAGGHGRVPLALQPDSDSECGGGGVPVSPSRVTGFTPPGDDSDRDSDSPDSDGHGHHGATASGSVAVGLRARLTVTVTVTPTTAG